MDIFHANYINLDTSTAASHLSYLRFTYYKTLWEHLCDDFSTYKILETGIIDYTTKSYALKYCSRYDED